MAKKVQRRIPRLWGGFVDGKLDISFMDTGWGGFGCDGKRKVPAIFKSKKDAREQYQDVRPLVLTVST